MYDQTIPIAVVGISCRLPGGANSTEKLWKILAEGRDTWSDVPADRWNEKSFHHPHPEAQGAHNHRGGHFIDQDLGAFDARFFGVPPVEAASMDPQQRLLLEVAYEAFENAGISSEEIRGSNTGVYISHFTHDYEVMMMKDADVLPNYLMTGIGQAIIANRISYVFDLKGPSLTIDTACSGSLVALHQACQSLRTRESSTVLTGGANLLLNPDIMIPMSSLHFLNDHGKCYAFDSRGTGYGRGEGVAMVVLKRLDDALKAGDTIRAVIRNTGIGQDGKTSGITNPNGQAQQDLARSLYEAAHLDPRDTTYVEAHGTGTVAGDTTEINAIGSYFYPKDRKDPLYVGSIKANIGHLESSSGIAGMIKTVLALEKGFIPPQIDLVKLKEDMLPNGKDIRIPQKLIPWPKDRLRRASVNSFGYGGTNAHAILEVLNEAEYHVLSQNETHREIDSTYQSTDENQLTPQELPMTPDDEFPDKDLQAYKSSVLTYLESHVIELRTSQNENTSHTDHRNFPPHFCQSQSSQMFTVTAKSEKSLLHAMENLYDWASTPANCHVSLKDLAYTLNQRRSIMPWRYTFTLDRLQDMVSPLKFSPSFQRASNNTKTVFLFTGQGAQWFAMGKELMSTSMIFRKSLIRSEKIMKELGCSWSLMAELSQEESTSRVNDSEIGQPASTSIQLALVDLFQSLQVKPDMVLGHSSGEIAAAYAASILTHESALMVSYHRSFLSRRCKKVLTAAGAMLAVGLGEEEVSPYISRIQSGTAVVACVNSPSSTTISGDDAAIVELDELLQSASVFSRRLKVDTAYHSHHMKAVADSYLHDLDGLQFRTSASVRFFSSVTGKEKFSDFGASYWVEGLVSKVDFSNAFENLYEELLKSQQGSPSTVSNLFIEIGPHNALAGPVRQIMKNRKKVEQSNFLYLPSLVRGRNALHTVLESVGSLFSRGCPVDLKCANALDGVERPLFTITTLPSYPWDHSASYWAESRLSREHRQRAHPYHDLLGNRVVGSSACEPVWRHVLSVEGLPWLQEHAVDGFATFPASGYLAMAIEAKRQIHHERQVQEQINNYILKSVVFTKALIIPKTPGKVELYLTLKGTNIARKAAAIAWEDFNISSVLEDGTWHEHCHGSIKTELTFPKDDFDASRAREKIFANRSHEEKVKRFTGSRSQRLDGPSLYQAMKSKGNHYGTNFALIQELDLSEYQAVGTVVIPDVARTMPSNFMQDHVIHPGTLDALIHSCLPIFSQHSAVGSVFTTTVGELSISSSLTNSPGEHLRFITDILVQGSSAATINICATQYSQKLGNEIVIRITSGELRGVAKPNDPSAGLYNRQRMNFQLKWGEDSDFFHKSTFNAILPVVGPEDEVMLLTSNLHLLTKASSIYVKGLLEEVTEDQVHEQRKQYFGWLNKFYFSDDSQSLIKGISELDIKTCLQQAQNAGTEGEGICRIGSNLTAIVTGKLDLLPLMMEDDHLFRAYTTSPSSRCYRHMAEYVKKLLFKTPRMTVLEIGAGTGSASKFLFDALARGEDELLLNRYDFTDISAGFFEHARELLYDYSRFINYQALDIGRDPVEQGFIPGSYDLIIASNALHATPSLNDAIANARRLLKPGGRLLLVETTNVTPSVNFLFGSLPTWYIGTNDGRPDSPCISTAQWNSRLLGGSFNGVEFAANDYDGPLQRMTFIVSRAISQECEIRHDIPLIIMSNSTGNSEHFAFSTQLVKTFESRSWMTSLARWPLRESVAGDTLYVVVDDKANSLLANPSPVVFKSIIKLLTTAKQVLWVSIAQDSSASTNPDQGLLIGLARTARVENESLKVVTLDMQSAQRYTVNFMEKVVDIAAASFMMPQSKLSNELEYVYNSDQQILVPRLIPDNTVNALVQRATITPECKMGLFHQKDRPLKLHVETPGILDSIRFVDDDTAQSEISADEIEFQVMACGINFKDVLVALGQVKPAIKMVGECAGYVTKVGSNFKAKYNVGDRVCGWCGTAFASRARVHGHNSHLIPESIPFTVAASIPVVYNTAYYGLVQLANLQKGQAVLVHAAAGGVGQAAIHIANHIGATIFATVGSASKRQFLIDTFNIPEDHIFSSRTGSFRRGLLRLTKDKGVDVVLNSLSGELLHESWACVSQFGSFIEIGKADIYAKSSINMETFDKNVVFASVDLALISDLRPETNQQRMSTIMSMFASGEYLPIQPLTVLPMSEIESAFRLLQGGKQHGKVVLEADENVMVKVLPAPLPVRMLCPDATYVVAGGLGGLGLEIAMLMAERGAKHIALLSRKEQSAEQRMELQKKFRLLGTDIRAISCDITDSNQCRELVSSSFRDLPPVKGVIQAAMVLQDRLLENMNSEDFKVPLGPKVLGTRHLSEAFSGPCLDFFIMLSSAVGILGSRGTGNYGAGNAFQDAFANAQQFSSDSHTHYISVDLGAMRESGVLARNSKVEQLVTAQGVIPLANAELFALLEYSWSSQARKDNCRQIVTGFNRTSLERGGRDHLLANPMFKHLGPHGDSHGSGQDEHDESGSEKSLAAAQSPAEAQEIIAASLAKKISTLVVTDLDPDVPLAEFGLDSLIVIELKNWIAREFQATLQTADIFEAASINILASTVAIKSPLCANEVQIARKEEQSVTGHFDTPKAKIEISVSDSNGSLPLLPYKETIIPPAVSSHLPKQPLPNLEDTLRRFHAIAALQCSSEDELLELQAHVDDFSKPDGLGRRLHSRLEDRANDAQIENWHSDMHLRHEYLKSRLPLRNFFGSHSDSQLSGTAAGKAAALSLAAFRCKQMIDLDGTIRQDILAGKFLDTVSYQGIFNGIREPRPGEDRVVKYGGDESDYLVVLRHGRYFKIMLRKGSQTKSHAELKASFEQILAIEQQTPAARDISILTADGRDEWSQYREQLKSQSEMNAATLQTIEAAAFLVCLDKAEPETPYQRAYQFFAGNYLNRWHDKSLQLVVCDNGASATICEHSLLDGISTAPLREFIGQALEEPPTEPVSNVCDQANYLSVEISELRFASTSSIDKRISFLTQNVDVRKSVYSYAGFEVAALSKDLFRDYKCPANSGFQLVIQLASSRFFGYTPTSAETVSMACFRQGRVAVNHTVLPEVVEFCTAIAMANLPPQAAARLFYQAASALSRSLSRTANRGSVSSHLLAMEWMLREDEVGPALFNDRTYRKTMTPRVLVDCLETGLIESGGPINVAESFFVHFQGLADKFLLSIWGNGVVAEKFRGYIETAAVDISLLLDGSGARDN